MTKGTRLSFSEKQNIIKKYENGYGLAQIARITYRSKSTVQNLLTKVGLYEPGVNADIQQQACRLFARDKRAARNEQKAQGNITYRYPYKNIWELPEEEKKSYFDKAREIVTKKCKEQYEFIFSQINVGCYEEDNDIDVENDTVFVTIPRHVLNEMENNIIREYTKSNTDIDYIKGVNAAFTEIMKYLNK